MENDKIVYFCFMKKLFILFLFNILALGAWAQGCVTCTNTAAQLGQDSAKGLNLGILYLVVIPFGFVASVGIWWYRKNKANQITEPE